MSEIRWIKLDVNMFDDEKIKLIRSMPEGDKILLIWIQLLCLAGRTNDRGSVYIGQNMYYTDEMLSTICNQPLSIVRIALKTFEQFNMLHAEDNGLLYIENWEKHQNVEGMDKIREQTRKRVAKHRERKALEQSNVTVTLRNATEEDKNKNKNKNNSSDVYESVMEAWNALDDNIPRITSINSGTIRYKNLIARINQYGEKEVIEAINKIDDSSFLKGYVSDFRITFDWFIKPNNFIKVLEGNYDDSKNHSPTNLHSKDKRDDESERQAFIEKKLQQKIQINYKNRR